MLASIRVSHVGDGVLDFRASPIDRPMTVGALSLLQLWVKLRADLGGLPGQDDFTLDRLRCLAAHTFLVAVDETADGLGRYTYRRAGTEVDELLRRGITGRSAMGLFSDEIGEQVHLLYEAVLSSREPACIAGRYIAPDKNWFDAEAIHLPIRGPRGRGMRLLVGLFRVNAKP